MTLNENTAAPSAENLEGRTTISYEPPPPPPPPASPAEAPSTPRRGPGRPVRTAIAVVVTLALLSMAIAVGALWRSVEGVDDDVATLRDDLAESAQTVDSLEARIGAVEGQLGASFDPSVVAEAATSSVYMVVAETGDGSASIGTAFVLANDGRRSQLVTNFHVIEARWQTGARDVGLVRGSREYTATIVKVSPMDDLALLEVQADLPSLDPAVDPAQTGDQVLVIGAGDGLEGTVTIGVVSAPSRVIDGDPYLQISAQVNPGNSGGPVLNADGDVVGVVTLKIVEVEIEGLAFAIPIDQVCTVLGVC